MVSNQTDTSRKSSVSNELSSLANQLNVSNDFVCDEPETETETQTEDVQPSSTANDDPNDVDATADNHNQTDLVVDDVNCSVTNENIEDTSSEQSTTSEFIHLKKTTTALQSYLEQFQMENIKSNESGETFDATEELLKMLDKENNE